MTAERQLSQIGLTIESTKRPTNTGAEKWLNVPIEILDHGYLYLVDYMGGDSSIVQAARVSYGKGTKSVNEDEGLIRYLRRHRHSTPFEMVEFKFHAKMPIFVARDWVRHRTANINEYSGRYSILDNEFYIPDPSVLGVQSRSNRQGRGESVPPEYAREVLDILKADAARNYDHYQYILNDDGNGKPLNASRPMIAKELARMDLTLNIYTQWYWKCDLHNIFHFLGLRMDPTAQWELRQYANAIADIVKDAVPMAWRAYEDYQMKAVNVTRPEMDILSLIFNRQGVKITKEQLMLLADETGLTNKRERGELESKFAKLGLLEE